MLKMCDKLGRKAWTKEGATALTMQGDKDGDLVSMMHVITKLDRTLT